MRRTSAVHLNHPPRTALHKISRYASQHADKLSSTQGDDHMARKRSSTADDFMDIVAMLPWWGVQCGLGTASEGELEIPESGI